MDLIINISRKEKYLSLWWKYFELKLSYIYLLIRSNLFWVVASIFWYFVAKECSTEEQQKNELLNALKAYKGHSVSFYKDIHLEHVFKIYPSSKTIYTF